MYIHTCINIMYCNMAVRGLTDICACLLMMCSAPGEVADISVKPKHVHVTTFIYSCVQHC